jgi:uncharacterized SAM-binding protein YcdF (DUF218 family)
MWTEPEADQFAAIAIKMGVPERSIFVENKSTNTGENILFTQQLLAHKNLDPQSFILVQKPYMERRSYATFKQYWPVKNWSSLPPKFLLKLIQQKRYRLKKLSTLWLGIFSV